MKKYRCSICGQIVEVEEGQNCPMCGSPFELLEEVKEETVKEYKKIEGPIPISDYNPSIERIEKNVLNVDFVLKYVKIK